MARKNDKKRKHCDCDFGDSIEYFPHPYNTRSNTPPPLKEISLDKPPAAVKTGVSSHIACSNLSVFNNNIGEDQKKVPLTLYNAIKQAVASKAVWEAKKTKLSESESLFAESFVKTIASCYKKKDLLPISWEFDPALASMYEPTNDFPSMPRSNGKPTRSKYGLYDDSYICILSTYPQVDAVPLKECEKRSWQEFKELDKGNFSNIPGTGSTLTFPLSTKHPFVEVIGNFAINGFNQAFEKYVEGGNDSRLSSPTFRKCTYSKSGGFYEFKMTIWCDEDGFQGIYEADVACTIDNCKKTLWSLVLTSVKQGKVKRASKSKRSEDVGLWLPGIEYTGMRRRCTFYGIIYGGYDYRDPNFICI